MSSLLEEETELEFDEWFQSLSSSDSFDDEGSEEWEELVEYELNQLF